MKFSIKAAALFGSLIVSTLANAGVINTYNIDFTDGNLSTYKPQNGSSDFKAKVRGKKNRNVLDLKENAWMALNLKDEFGIDFLNLDDKNSKYVFNFGYRMTGSAASFNEIGGFWAADLSKGEVTNQADRTFNMKGIQDFGMKDVSYTNDGKWQNFSVTLNDFISGNVTDFIFINDCDAIAGCGNATVRFRDASITQVSEPTAASLLLVGVAFMGWRKKYSKSAI